MTQNFLVRKMHVGEIDQCRELWISAWNLSIPDRPRKNCVDFDTEIEKECVLDEDVLVGFIAYLEAEAFIHHLYIHPSHQRKGVGSALIEAMLVRTASDRCWLKCHLINRDALAFYKAKGFELIDEVGEDEYGMWVRMKWEQ